MLDAIRESCVITKARGRIWKNMCRRGFADQHTLIRYGYLRVESGKRVNGSQPIVDDATFTPEATAETPPRIISDSRIAGMFSIAVS